MSSPNQLSLLPGELSFDKFIDTLLHPDKTYTLRLERELHLKNKIIRRYEAIDLDTGELFYSTHLERDKPSQKSMGDGIQYVVDRLGKGEVTFFNCLDGAQGQLDGDGNARYISLTTKEVQSKNYLDSESFINEESGDLGRGLDICIELVRSHDNTIQYDSRIENFYTEIVNRFFSSNENGYITLVKAIECYKPGRREFFDQEVL